MLPNLDLYLQECSSQNVHPTVMKAIIKTETRGNPLAISLNGNRNNHRIRLLYQPRNFTEAVSWVNYLDQHGYNFDVGIAQVNIKNIRAFGVRPSDALNVCTNLQMASFILKYHYNKALNRAPNNQLAIKLAISAYNTGNFHKGFANGYVKTVIRNYNSQFLKKS